MCRVSGYQFCFSLSDPSCMIVLIEFDSQPWVQVRIITKLFAQVTDEYLHLQCICHASVSISVVYNERLLCPCKAWLMMTSKWPNYQECFVLQAWLNYFNFYRCLQFRSLIKWLIRSTSNSAPGRVLNWNVALMIHRYTQKVHFPCGVLLQVVLLSSQTLVQFHTVSNWGQNCIIWSASLASWIPWVIEYLKTFYLNNTYFSGKVAGLPWKLTATNSLPQLFLNCCTLPELFLNCNG